MDTVIDWVLISFRVPKSETEAVDAASSILDFIQSSQRMLWGGGKARMLTGHEQETKPMSANRKLWLGFCAALLIVLIYVGWVFYSRWHENSEISQEVKTEQAQKERQQAAATVETLGGSAFKIISFYASPGEIHRGDDVTMCYGTSNAESVSVDPPVGEVWPSVNRCFPITPKKTTKYTFTADDGKGNKKTEELTIVVK